ncbi:hypothetical protein DYB38_003240 [Aphanomyces astaci]|uniref:Uncharacterized protein n=1 Tax=Aphanomyces astaci TaxID=112090 RepID=A0A397E1C2_APHAT|nr:hypothetical protein DYB38_003240 [Aphanomyces astaci]
MAQCESGARASVDVTATRVEDFASFDTVDTIRNAKDDGIRKSSRVHPFKQSQDEVQVVQQRLSLTGRGSKLTFPVTKNTTPSQSDTDRFDDLSSMTMAESVETAGGVAYLLITLVLSMYYLKMLAPVMTNDLWWADFNASGAHSYLIDVFNSNLNLNVNNTAKYLDVTAGGFSKDYSTFYTPIRISPLYERIVRADQATNLTAAIIALQEYPRPESAWTQYCWVDFNRMWEVAHTAKRQTRCGRRYTANAAMYWETIFRLINWNKYMTKYASKFKFAMGRMLNSTTEGKHWLKQTANAFVSVETEVAVWKAAGLTTYQWQWANHVTWGVKESMDVINAFGATQSLSIKQVATERKGSWTTIVLSWGPWNDYMFGLPFIRSDPRHARFMEPCSYDDFLLDPGNYTCDPCDPVFNPDEYMSCSYNCETMLDIGGTPGFGLTHNHVGPFGSIDALFVPAPPSLLVLSSSFTLAITTWMQTQDAFNTAMTIIPSLTVDPVPMKWQSTENGTFTYMGGDITCPTREPKPYVQSSFSFDVSCTNQERHKMLLHPRNALFAYLISSKLPIGALKSTSDSAIIAEWCGAVCPTLASSCAQVLGAVVNASKQLPTTTTVALTTLARRAQSDVTALQVKTIQYAKYTSTATDHEYGSSATDVWLEQLVLSDDDKWDFFGWVYMFEWAEASREVVSFEGDNGIFALVSDKATPLINEAQYLEVPKSACQYVWVVSAIVSVILVIVGFVMTTYTALLRGRIVGRNLFQFNRIVGAVWIGRPFLMIRGMTAIVLLSTAPIRFMSQKRIASFEFHPRTLLESMLVSGEAMWITYIVNDFMLPLTRNAQSNFAPLSAGLSWLVYVCWDMSAPPALYATLDRNCDINYFRSTVVCHSGAVQLGDAQRVMTLLFIQLVSIIMSFGAVCVWQCVNRHLPAPTFCGHLLLSGTATAFLHKDIVLNGALLIDRASCVMCGLLTFRQYIFDLKLWLLTTQQQIPTGDPSASAKPRVFKWNMPVFLAPYLKSELVTSPSPSPPSPKDHRPQRPKRVATLIGLGYMCATVFGSVTYLSLTKTSMANDFWWANYNASREHVFIARMYNREMVLRPEANSIALDDHIFVDDTNYSSVLDTAVGVFMPPLYVSQIKLADATKLAVVVRGLRHMDACLAPWIATQYCWLDFQQRWEMANSVARQARCASKYATNGAVYLEAVLRNVQWATLQSCWGRSLEIAIAAPLRLSSDGSTWWASLESTVTSELDEVAIWHSHNISTYDTDWQDYKSIGIIDTYNIQNAFGFSYPMTLKHTNGSLQLNAQTSMKMYWAFASDLWAVTDPSTFIFGKSLVRQTGQFAFANVSMESVLLQNGTVAQVESGAFAIFRDTIGPFGSVDVKHVAVPPSVVRFVLHVTDTLTLLRTKSLSLSVHYSALDDQTQFAYIPAPWLESGQVYGVGGNIMCPESAKWVLVEGLCMLTGGACNVGVGEFISPTTFSRLAGVIALNMVVPSVNTTHEGTALCSNVVMVSVRVCQDLMLDRPLSFLKNSSYFGDNEAWFSTMAALAATAQADVRNVGVEVFQYGTGESTSSNVTFLRHTLFDESLPGFHLLSWYLVVEWCLAQREVISLQGDRGTINLLTYHSADVGSLVNPLELPVNVALYIRYACLYVTSAIICVAFLSTLYLLANRGYMEGLNMLELNRVAGVVWVGRTLLFVRGLAAISLLSTQVLTLTPVGDQWGFRDPRVIVDETATDQAMRFFKTFLAAGEVSWLGFVLSDMLIVMTQQYTTAYVFKCNFMVWGASALLSWIIPATHTATMTRQCEMPQVDFQLVCTSGTIAIGSFGRFVTLIGVCVGSIAICYAYERLRHPHLETQGQASYFLSASAKYMFEPKHWTKEKVYYIDPASAVINGILSIQVKNTFYIFDLKIWRFFVIDEPHLKRKRLHDEGAFHLLQAIPLTD